MYEDCVFEGSSSSGYILSNFHSKQPIFKRYQQFPDYDSVCQNDLQNYAYLHADNTPDKESANFVPQFEGRDYPQSFNESFVVVDVNEPFSFLYASQGWLDMMQCSAEELESKNLCVVVGLDMDRVRPLIMARHVESETTISLASRTGRTIRMRIYVSATSEWQGVQSCTLTMNALAGEEACFARAHHEAGETERTMPPTQHCYEPEQGYDNACFDYGDISPFQMAPDTPETPNQNFHPTQAPKIPAMLPTFDESPISVTQHSFFWVPPLTESSSQPCWQASPCEVERDRHYSSDQAYSVQTTASHPQAMASPPQPTASPPSPLKRSRSMISPDYCVPPLSSVQCETQSSPPSETALPASALSSSERETAKKAKHVPRSFLRLVPRRKGGKDAQGDSEEVRGGYGKAVELTREKIDEMSGKSLKQAAAEMGLAASTLKKACRRIGIERWPHRPETVSPQLPLTLLYDSAYVRRIQCKYAAGKSKGSPKSPVL